MLVRDHDRDRGEREEEGKSPSFNIFSHSFAKSGSAALIGVIYLNNAVYWVTLLENRLTEVVPFPIPSSSVIYVLVT